MKEVTCCIIIIWGCLAGFFFFSCCVVSGLFPWISSVTRWMTLVSLPCNLRYIMAHWSQYQPAWNGCICASYPLKCNSTQRTRLVTCKQSLWSHIFTQLNRTKWKKAGWIPKICFGNKSDTTYLYNVIWIQIITRWQPTLLINYI